MKIALIGYGKMGREVESLALSQGHHIVTRIDPGVEGRTSPTISNDSLFDAEVCIEFTNPSAVVENIHNVALLKKPLVVGTTGWTENFAEVRSLVDQQGIGLVYAPNFSLGVNLFYRIAARAAELFSHFADYDVYGAEVHHRHKIDSPSGTAKKLAALVLEKFPHKKRIVTGPLDGPIAPEELHLVSVRAGESPGIHSLTFDSLADTIELTHTARSRAGFARGALLAAEWILHRKGFFSFEEILDELLGQGEG
jgi:4-hydroxy-tetrahydrodipicolinate reductase